MTLLWNYIKSFFIYLIITAFIGTEVLCNVVSVRVGQTAHLPCEVDHSDPSLPPYVIEWSRKGNSVPIFIKIGKYPKRVNQHFKGRMWLKPNSATLWIQRVVAQDEGWYVCHVLFLNHPVSHEVNEQQSNGTWVHLVVTAPPTITFAPPFSVEGRERESLLLRCRIEGRPKPEITWWKDGWLLKDGENGVRINEGELEVRSLKKSHRGSYECRGINADGQVEDTTIVHIKAPPEMTLAPKNVTVKETQEAFFNCKATGYPTNITYHWLYNGVPISQVQSFSRRHNTISVGTLVLYNVNRHDKGQVTCRASNGYGSPIMASAYLIVQYAARVINMPSETFGGLLLPLTLTCECEGEPPVTTVAWRKDGHMVANDNEEAFRILDNGSLYISHVKYSDEGRYTCTPYNMLGTHGESSQMFLIVREPPKFTLRPKSEFEVEIGAKLQLYCEGRGDPTPSLRWKKAGKQMDEYPNERVYWSGGNITLTSIQQSDHGLWQCVLSNPVAEVTTDVMILVKYTTPQVVTNVTVQTSAEGAIVTWSPSYDGGYPQHFIVWYKRSDKGDHTWSAVQVPGNHRREVVSRLEPETVYQFAVLSENVLGSGPFSKVVTKMTEALPTQPSTRKVNNILPPRNLTSSTNENGLLVLSWEELDSMHPSSLLGYLVEFRLMSDESPLIQPMESVKTNREYEARSKRALKGTSTFIQEIYPVSKRSLPVGLWKTSDSQWEILGAYPPNTTMIELPPKRLFRNKWYEFHVLAVTPLAYGPPSQSIIIQTSGMTAYGVLAADQAQASTGIILGVVAGTLFVFFALSLALIYCLRHRKGADAQTVKEEAKESFLANQNANPDSSKSHVLPPSSDVTPRTGISPKQSSTGNDKLIPKNGVLQKIKSKLERGKSNCDVTRRPLIRTKEVKRTQSLPHGNSSRPIAPINRSTDGKFHLNDHTKEKPPMSHVIRRNQSERLYAESDSEEVWKRTRRKEHFKKNRPVSDSILHHDADNMRKYWGLRSSREGAIEELDEEDARLEIDCSRSDIEVRYIPQDMKKNSRRSSSEKSQHPPLSPNIHTDAPCPKTEDNTLPSQAVTPCASGLGFQDHFYNDRVNYPQRSPIPFNFQPEYVYLKDLGISSPGTPCSDVTDPRCFSPGVEFMSLRYPTPANPPRVKYHSHTLVPGGHYHLSPRGSYSTRTPSLSPISQFSRRQDRTKSPLQELAGISQNLYVPHAIQSNNLNENDESISTHPSIAIQTNISEQERKSKSSPTRKNSHGSFYDDEIVERKTSPNEPIHATPQRNNNNNKTPSSKALSFRSHSYSLPSLSQRKSVFQFDDRRSVSRRSASEELLGKLPHTIREIKTDGDTDSDRRFSFTSGSASTVRHVPSRESNLSTVGSQSNDKIPESLSSFRKDADPNFPEQSPRSEKSSVSMSPLIPSEAGGASSSSGYDSQNASSENSSHTIRPSGLPNKRNIVTNNQNEGGSSPHHHGDRDVIQPLNNQTHFKTKTANSTFDAPSNSRTKRDTSTSSDTKCGKDTSIVDEKYEWDSAVAIESDILEALRRLGTHQHDGPVSRDVIQELQKLNVSEPDKDLSQENSPLIDAVANDNDTLSDSDDDSYSKQTMAQRCAALKEEYFEHKRRVLARKQSFASTDNQC